MAVLIKQITECYDMCDAMNRAGMASDIRLTLRQNLRMEMVRFVLYLVPEKDAPGKKQLQFIKDNLNDTDGAIEDYTMAISLKPDYAYSYLGRGDMYMKKGEKEAARSDYQRAVELDTVYSESNCAQYAYLGLGETDKAKAFQAGILDSIPSAGNYYDAACLYARMGEKEESLKYLKLSFEKGFRRFAHIRNDDDLEAIKGTDEFCSLIQEYERKHEEELKEMREESGVSVERQEVTSEIPFTVEGGNCFVNCKINDLPMKFVFDTGASDVSLSMVEATL